jgi:hypothetical protein
MSKDQDAFCLASRTKMPFALHRDLRNNTPAREPSAVQSARPISAATAAPGRQWTAPSAAGGRRLVALHGAQAPRRSSRRVSQGDVTLGWIETRISRRRPLESAHSVVAAGGSGPGALSQRLTGCAHMGDGAAIRPLPADPGKTRSLGTGFYGAPRMRVGQEEHRLCCGGPIDHGSEGTIEFINAVFVIVLSGLDENNHRTGIAHVLSEFNGRERLEQFQWAHSQRLIVRLCSCYTC